MAHTYQVRHVPKSTTGIGSRLPGIAVFIVVGRLADGLPQGFISGIQTCRYYLNDSDNGAGGRR